MRPLCKCHGEPMESSGWINGRQYWKCRVARREGYYRRRIESGRAATACAKWDRARAEARDVQLLKELREWR